MRERERERRGEGEGMCVCVCLGEILRGRGIIKKGDKGKDIQQDRG